MDNWILWFISGFLARFIMDLISKYVCVFRKNCESKFFQFITWSLIAIILFDVFASF